MLRRIPLTVTALAGAIVLAAGCGDDGASSSGAASLAPAGSLVYGEATLAPEGDQKAAIDALLAKFPGEGNAGERIRSLMEKAFAESDSGLSYESDVEPWLGDEAGFFVSELAPDGEDAGTALVVATEDEGKAEDAIEKAAKGQGKRASYKDHDYYALEDHGAAGVVEGWVVLGNERGFKAAIDTVEGGEPIEDDEAFERTLEDAPDERLGFLYMNSPALYEELQKSAGAAMLPQQLRRVFEEPLLATVDANDTGVRFEGTVPPSLLAGFPVVAEGGGAAGELPAGSWLAMAQPELGKTLEGYVDLFAGAAGGRDVVARQFEAATGLDLEQDVLSWMGDWSVFVRGTSVSELDGAMTIETSDEAASGRFIDAVGRLARKDSNIGNSLGPLDLAGGGEGLTMRSRELPQPIHLLQREGRVVMAYGDTAARDALDPAETLSDTPAYGDAEAALGGDYAVSFYLAIAPVLELAQSAGAASDEEFQQALPYLEPLGALVGGAREDGDKLRSAFGLTVK
jgi:hypothetical protein